MLEFLETWRAELGGLAFFLAGIVVSSFYYRRSRIRGRISYFVGGQTLIGEVAVGEYELPEQLEVRYGGAQVPQLARNEFVLWNAGEELVRGIDVVETDPLRVELRGDDSQVLEARIVRETRSANQARIEVHQPRDATLRPLPSVRITFDYLEPGDGIRLVIHHTASPADLELVGSIRGIPAGPKRLGLLSEYDAELAARARERKDLREVPIVSLVFAALAGIALILSKIDAIKEGARGWASILAIFAVMAPVFFVIAFLRRRFKLRRLPHSLLRPREHGKHELQREWRELRRP